jgi:signal transduction histidine kinase
MAHVTSFITGSGGFDETRWGGLQNAIENINPSREGARVRTGDKELAGLELAVNKLIERMHESYRQQARFVSDASHELRTPIAVIQGYANMLSRWGKDDEKVLSESIEAISAESERMKRLVEQLLFLARGDAGRIVLKQELIDLRELMREVYDESRMISPDHNYILAADSPVYARGDADSLKQVVRILVENAIKYTPPGLDIILKTGETDGVPTITVQDCGAGIPDEDVPHIFERFYRADGARTRGTGGTGLGLAIAKWIADKHGGWFELVSREALGTRVSLCLPKPEGGQLTADN